MRISEGTSVELADGSWLKFDVEVDYEDLKAQATEWGVHPSQLAGFPIQGRVLALRAMVQQIIVQRTIEARTNDGTNWVEASGTPSARRASDMLSQIKQFLLAQPVKESGVDPWS